MNDDEIRAIWERARKAHPEIPSVRLSFGERFINEMNKTPLYVRHRNNKPTWTDNEVAGWVNSLMADAYQAEKDREALLDQIDQLRASAGRAELRPESLRSRSSRR